jgi:hypothetical protein
MDFIMVIVGGILVLAVLKVAIPAIVQLLDAILIAILRTPFRILANTRQLDPYELSRRRAVASAFVLVFCLYLLRTGRWPVDPVPPWLPLAVMVVAGVSPLLMLAALYGTRHGPRDVWGAVASLVIAAGSAALLWWQWHLPLSYDFLDTAVHTVNRMLPGLYIAALIAALVRASVCIQLFGGAARIVARAMRRRAAGMRPASSPGSGFWAEMRASFERGRNG